MSASWWTGVTCLALLVGLTGGLGWARRRLLIVRVTGWSMAPALADGDRLLVRRRGGAAVRRGDVVVLAPPAAPSSARWYVKRAVAIGGDPVPAEVASSVPPGTRLVPTGSIVVLGDNPASEDSRQWGLIAADRLLGVAVTRLPAASAELPV